MKWFRYQIKRYLIWGLAGVLILLSIIPVRLAIATHQAPQPQAILVLGGTNDREYFSARFAKLYPNLEIWVSTGSPPQYIRDVFAAQGVSSDRLHLDYRAVDTVTNFTTLVADFKQREIQHIFLITSDFHMPRAMAIATFVLGSQGIAFNPVRVYTGKPQESVFRILRDSGRALMWIVTGRTGASLRSSRLNHAFGLLHPRQLHSWSTLLETAPLVFFGIAPGSELLAAGLSSKSLDAPTLWRADRSAGSH